MPRSRGEEPTAQDVQLEAGSDAEVVVQGVHVTEADPEIGLVTTELSARARRRDDVFERLRERAEWQRGILERFAAQIERDEMATHHVHPLVDREASDMPVGYVGEIRTKITLKDLSCAGDLVSALSLGDMSEVLSLMWGLKPNSPVHRATRIAAVHDGLTRARDYCAAVGSQLTSLLSIREAEGGTRSELVPATRILTSPDHPPGALFDFRPTIQTVRSVVDVRFSILQPKFA
jgi:uncharacterized protein YggE